MIVSQKSFLRLPYRVRKNCPTSLTVRAEVGATSFFVPANIEFEEWQSSWMTSFLATMLRGVEGVFIDVGVNKLQTFFDLRGSGDSREYIGFEPNPHCVAYALDVIRLNAIERATIVPCALASSPGILNLFLQRGSAFDSTGSILEELRPGRDFDRAASAALTLDSALAHLGVGRIALLKIDVEGGELEVLRGASETLRAKRPLILCEVLYRDAKADATQYAARIAELFALLDSTNYVALRLMKPGNTPHIQSLLRIDHIGTTAWTPENFSECDYVFCPREELQSRFEGRYPIV
jgi:FkbM family methyltransferase